MPASTVLTPISATHLNSTSASGAQLVLTFNDDILAGTGLLTISDGSTQTYIGKDGALRTRLIGATDTRTIDITDTSKVSISGSTVTISLDSNLSAGKNYSVQMARGVLLDENGNDFAGLANTSQLPFTTASTPVPAAVIDSGLAFRYDTGSSASDFITKTTVQGVDGKFTGVLAAGDFIEVSLDNGGTWLVAAVANDRWSVEGTLTGSSTIIARVSNADGGHSTAVRQAYTLDNDAATVESITLSDADFVAGETGVVTIRFNEAVTGLALADFAVTGGVLSNPATTDNGKTWTATLTPTINVTNGVGQVALLAGGVDDLAGNSGPASAAHVSFAYSTVPNQPSAIVTSASMTDSGSSNSDFITNSTAQTFTGQYSGTLAADEYIEVSLDGGTTYAKATATAGAWSIPATTISAGNTLKARVTNGYTYSNPLVQGYTLDQAGPATVDITLADSTIGLGETSLVTIKFNEAVVNFSNDDITVSGGTLSAVGSVDGGVTWTATFTPAASTLALSNALTVNKAGLADIAGNAGAGSASSANYAVDTVRPTVHSISVADTALRAGETTTVTFVFSEVVTGLGIADITVANGVLSALASSDAGLTWTATLTPTDSVDDTSNIITLDNTGIADTAGNAGSGATSSGNYTIDTRRPTAAIAIADADGKLAAGESATVTITFSEAVSGLSSADFTVGNGTLSAPTTSDNGITWTATLTPAASVDATSNVIVLNSAGVTDAAGNTGAGAATSGAYAVATLRPTVSTITVSDTALKAGDTATVTITFAEAVSGLTAADFNVEHGTLSEPVTTDNGMTWSATLTPTSAIDDTTNAITLNNTGYTDSDGNTGTGSTSSANYVVDTVRPLTASIGLADSALTAGDTTTVTFTFSEAVTGLTAAAVTVANGSLSTPVSSDGGITWTATLTPATSVDDASNVITLDNTAITDSIGNAGSGVTSSANYTVATVRPTVNSIVVADGKLTAGETATVTITFSEAVSGLSTADLAVGNGSLSTLTTSDNGVTWTAILTPHAGVDGSPNFIVLNNAGVTDSAGNAGTGTSSSGSYAVATKRPAVVDAITVSDTALKAGDTATITVTFSEAVSGLTAADFSYGHGTLSAPVSTDNGVTWTATLTPTPAAESTGSDSITLDTSGVTDSDGNAGSGSTSPVHYTVDTKAPTATIALSDNSLSLGESTTVTITFSEAVSDFSSADVTVSGGTLSTLTTADNITWTATLTPLTTGSGSGAIALATSSVIDAAGNSGPSQAHSASFSYAVPPTITVTSVALSADTGTSGDFITNTVSQTISGAISAALSAGEFVEVSLDGGNSWSALPSFAGTSWTWSGQTLDGSDTLMARVSNSGASGAEFSHAYRLDQDAPTASITLSESALLTGETATVTITFSEAVTGLTLADFKSAGTLSDLTSNSDGTVWTATLAASGSGEVRLDPSSVSDVAGNSGPAAAVYANYTYNATPTATIATVSMTDLHINGDFITNSTSQVISGSLSEELGRGQFVEVSLNNGATWTRAETIGTSWQLSGQTIDGNNTLKVRASNGTATGTEYSHEYVLDQAAPILSSISIDNASLRTGQTATVTVVFNEAVSGLAAADFAISGATLGSFSTSDSRTWTATLTPTASGSVALSSSTVTDTAGNSGPAASSETRSFTFTVDNTAPSATLALSDTTLIKSQAATLTVTFSEAVTDTPTASDFTVEGGSLGTFTSSDGGATWTATLTPAEGGYGQGSVTLNAGTITDPSSNAGPASNVSLPFNYDTQTLSLASGIAFSSDNGTSSTDLITNTGTQTISGSFSGGAIYALMGAKIEVSTDNGTTWDSATIDNTTHTWSISATLSRSGTIQVRLTDGSGVTGTPVSQSYTIDTAAPGSLASVTPDLPYSSDTSNPDAGGSHTDNITSDDTPSIEFSLSSSGLAAGDFVDVLDTSNNNAILGTYEIQSSALGAYGGTISVTPETALGEGTHTLVLRARDTAGNTGTPSSALSITIDKTIASMAGKTLDLDAASDTGSSSTDNLTSDNTPSVTFNIANTSGLAAGDTLEVIDTANGNDVVYMYTVQAADVSASGANISVTLNQLSDGAHTLALRAQDKANNTGIISSTTLDITVDTTAPALSSSAPAPNTTGLNIGTHTITLAFDEALVTNAQTGFKITNSNNPDDSREFVFEALAGNTASYDSTTHTVTLSLSDALQYGGNYSVAVYNAPLADALDNSLAIGTLLLAFTTETPAVPSALTLSLDDSTYAGDGGADNDYITSDDTLTVSGITATYLQYKTSSDDLNWTTVMPTGSTYTMTLSHGWINGGEIQFRQYNVAGYESTSTVLADDWTIDTHAPTGYVKLLEFPLFFGGTAPISSISGTLEGEFNFDEEFIEYTTDGGASWSKAASTSYQGWNITGAVIAAGGELGLRTTDVAGNLGTKDDAPYTVYLGDGYGGNHTATGSKLLYTLYGNDTIDVSGAENTVDGGDGNDVVNILSDSTDNNVDGGDGSDTINVNGAYNTVNAGGYDDTITIFGAHNTVYGSDGADTITITGAFNDVDTGNGDDIVTITAGSGTVQGGSGNDEFKIGALGSTISGGYGDDIFEFNTSLAVTLSGTFDGGTDGVDKAILNVSGQTLILANLTSNLSHIERIDLGANNRLTISGDAIKTMSDTGLIRFDGDSSDKLYADASLWESAIGLDIVGYNKYQLKSDHSVAFIIDSDIVIEWSNLPS